MRVRRGILVDDCHKHRTELIFDDAIQLGTIAEVWCHASHFRGRCDTYLVPHPAVDGTLIGFIQARVTADRVCPDTGPCDLMECATLRKELAIPAKTKAAECTVQRCVIRVYGRFRGSA